MSQSGMAAAETLLAERAQETKVVTTPAEPATPRALWPTFMRRTLSDETLRAERPRG